MATIFPNLAAEMTRSCVRVEHIAKASRRSEQTVYNWLNGKVDITFDNVAFIRDTFFPGMSIDYLFWTPPDG